MFSGFRDFLLRGNVVELAVAVVIGAAFNDVVNGFITAFIDPIIALALGASGGTALETVVLGGFPVGVFISALITFLIKALVVYFFIVRPFASMAARFAPAPAAPAIAEDVKLLTDIRELQRQQLELLAGRRPSGN
jgi:large conductance mechanosensitive channel